MPTRFSPLWLQLAALMTAAPLYAQQAAVELPAAPSPTASGTAVEAGQQAAVDPQTGRIRGLSPEEARALVESLIGSVSHSDAGLVPVVLPSGARIVDLQGRFESATLAKIGPDGKVVSECVTTKEEAERFLTEAPVVSAAPLEEK